MFHILKEVQNRIIVQYVKSHIEELRRSGFEEIIKNKA